MLKDHPGDHRMPHRLHRIIVSALRPTGFEGLHQRIVRQVIERQRQAVEVGTAFNVFPGKEPSLRDMGHGSAHEQMESMIFPYTDTPKYLLLGICLVCRPANLVRGER